MKFDYLLTSGCSWSDSNQWDNTGKKKIRLPGWEVVDDDQVWPAILAKKLGVPLVNLARRGKGNQYIFDSIIDNLNGNPLVCVLWTEATRIELPHSKEIFRPQYIWEKKRKWDKETRLFYNMLFDRGYDLAIVAQKSWKLYTLLEKHCRLLGLDYIAGQGMKMWHDNHWDSFEGTEPPWDFRYMDSFWKDMHELKLIDNTGHPSIKGHEYIAEEFYKCTF